MPGQPPKRKGGQWQFDSPSVINWLLERERSETQNPEALVLTEEDRAKTRKLNAEASLAELKLAEAEGSAISIEDFELAWSAMIGASRAKLLGLSAALGPVVARLKDPVECRTEIEAAVKEALQELSEFEPQLPFDSEGYPEPEGIDTEDNQALGATSEPDGEPMGRHRTTSQQ